MVFGFTSAANAQEQPAISVEERKLIAELIVLTKAEIDYRQYVEDLIYPLYDQFYTEKELADPVAFYKTETGQKVIATMPQLFAESFKLSQQFLLPKVLDLLDRIMAEEVEALKKGPPPPRGH